MVAFIFENLELASEPVVPTKTTSVARSAAIAALLASAAGCQGAAASDDIHFQPHRAVYDVTLFSAVAASSVTGVTGRMVYELGGSACEGYTQNMRFVTRMTNQEGSETLNDMRTSSWEETGGKRLRFSSSQYQNDELAIASQGDAARSKDGDTAKVDLVKPEKSKVELPQGTLFPMQHATGLLKAAKASQTVFTANLYDGSEKGDKYYLTTSVIGKHAGPGAIKMPASLKDGARLDMLQSWPVAISYFDPDKKKQDSVPAYELSFRYFENGVTTDLKIDYGEFIIKGELKSLVFNDPGPSNCAGPANSTQKPSASSKF